MRGQGRDGAPGGCEAAGLLIECTKLRPAPQSIGERADDKVIWCSPAICSSRVAERGHPWLFQVAFKKAWLSYAPEYRLLACSIFVNTSPGAGRGQLWLFSGPLLSMAQAIEMEGR
ncbi:MAG: hypothetical protein ISP45_01725 [Reyranella sp.]|nr:hypothetical protein [Reyranella sp.]